MLHRTSPRSFVVSAALAGLIVIAAAGRAEAQFSGTGGTFGTGGTTGTGGSGTSVLQASDFFVGVEETPPVALSIFDQSRFFNKARCDCSQPVSILISLLSTGVAKRSQITSQAGTVSVVLGPGCVGTLNQQIGNCLPLPGGTEEVLTFLSTGQFIIPTDARTLSTFLNTSTAFDAGVAVGACQANGQFTQTVNINFDFDGDGVVDLPLTLGLLIDLNPPPPPMPVKIQGGDEALVMSWPSLDTSIVTDLQGYQILCSRADQYQVFKEFPNDAGGVGSGPFGAAFQTCPATRTGTGVEGLDPTFVCSGLLSAQATSARIEVLQNDITYAAAVVAVDNSGNPSEPLVGFGTPVKTLSFYDVYRDQTPQGGATGGFCALPTARPGVKTTAAALALFALGALGLAISRRRKGPR